MTAYVSYSPVYRGMDLIRAVQPLLAGHLAALDAGEETT